MRVPVQSNVLIIQKEQRGSDPWSAMARVGSEPGRDGGSRGGDHPSGVR